MFNDLPVIIAGGGASIPFPCDTPDPRLQEVLKNNICCGINYFNYFYKVDTTWVSFVDASEKANFYGKNLNWLRDQKLIIGRYSPLIRDSILDNTILVPKGRYYFGKDGLNFSKKICLGCKTRYELNDKHTQCPRCKFKLWQIGICPSHLSSMFALSLSIALGFKKIFLLGNDGCEVQGKTHFYQGLLSEKDIETKFKGVGMRKTGGYRTSTFSSPDRLNEEENRFGGFKNWKSEGLEIYNVSLDSVITLFPKVSYEQFYEMLGTQVINQDSIRAEIKAYIIDKQK